MRLLLVDPVSLQYDHELASSLVRAGVEVELLTSRPAFGDAGGANGYTRLRSSTPSETASSADPARGSR